MGVEFNENKPMVNTSAPSGGGLTNALIKMGLASSQKGSQKVMISIAIVCFLLAIYIAFK